MHLIGAIIIGFVIGLVARNHPMKDVKTFLRATAFFQQDHANAKFVLCGDGLSADNAPLPIVLPNTGGDPNADSTDMQDRPVWLQSAGLASLTFVLGGAAGNLYDRVLRGTVTDFIEVYHGGWSFPVFNVADSAITIGAVLLLFDLLILHRNAQQTIPK